MLYHFPIVEMSTVWGRLHHHSYLSKNKVGIKTQTQFFHLCILGNIEHFFQEASILYIVLWFVEAMTVYHYYLHVYFPSIYLLFFCIYMTHYCCLYPPYRFFQLHGDLDDLESALDGANISASSRVTGSGSCSALVKLLPGNSDLFVGHNTWTSYYNMLRIYKMYDFKYHMSHTDSKNCSYCNQCTFCDS